MIVTTDAVVLKGMRYGETSRILTLYTRDFGKLSVLAKGARDRKNRFGSALEPMSYVRAVFYRKAASDLHLLTQCDLVRPMRRLTEDMERMAPALAMVEMVAAVCHAEEDHGHLFGLLLESLSAVNDATKNPGNALYAFEVRLLELMGFKPNFHACFRCGVPVDESKGGSPGRGLHVSPGGIVCGECSSEGRERRGLSAGGAKVLQFLQDTAAVEASTALVLTPRLKNEIAGILRFLLESHLEGLRALKSEKVFSAIL